MLVVHGISDDTAVAGEADAPHSDDEENLSQGTVSLPDISASNNEDACKAIAHEAMWKSDVQLVTGKMNKSVRGMKIFLSRTRGFMIMPTSRNLTRLQTKSVLP